MPSSSRAAAIVGQTPPRVDTEGFYRLDAPLPRLRRLKELGTSLGASASGADGARVDGKRIDMSGIYRCRNAEGDVNACVGKNECYRMPVGSSHRAGETTMEGPFCGKCRLGFGQAKAGGLCFPCQPQIWLSVVYVLLGLGIFAVVASAMVMMQLRHDAQKPRQIHSIILKIFMNYSQMVTVVVRIRFCHRGSVACPQAAASQHLERVASQECFLPNDESVVLGKTLECQ